VVVDSTVGKKHAHRDHGTLDETVLEVEMFLRLVRLVGEKGDAEEVFLFGEVDGVIEEFGPVALTTVGAVDEEVFQEKNETTLGRADGDEEVDHADDLVGTAQDEDAAAGGLLEDELDAAHLFFAVGLEVGFLAEQFEKHLREFGEIVDGGGFDTEAVYHGIILCSVAENGKGEGPGVFSFQNKVLRPGASPYRGRKVFGEN